IEEPVQSAVSQAFESAGDAGKKVQNALNGTWLGHPLHPVLTDIPIGAWTTALVLDCMEVSGGRRGIKDAADAAIALGLAGSAAVAVTGLTDWKDLSGKDRRVGLVHGMLNAVVASLYTGSLIARRNKDRTLGRALAMTGWGLMLASAWIGGELVYRFRDGVNRANDVEQPSDWTAVMPESDLPDDQMKRAEHNGARILLLRRGSRILAIGETCSHQGGPLSEGKLEGDCVTCPWHGSTFDMNDGSVVNGPATTPQPAFEVRVRDGQIEVRAAK
ncbi:MAG TPA: Rieske 2Fe-2S domain-containing protein, partial [Bryobacteraceae bacterium]|nr:Rieske 2Fe-2S domain-containing protein [Bryobacteraceae bacterium]